MSKNHLGEAIESAVEKTLNAATEATSPQGEEYWYNLATGEVERGQQSAVTSLWGLQDLRRSRPRHGPRPRTQRGVGQGRRPALKRSSTPQALGFLNVPGACT